MTFIRNVEDFTCEHCAAVVKGSGYTNHCPKCLWSKHVDIDPGDRKELCGGLMEPVSIEGSTPKYRLIHKCLKCGSIRKVHVSDDDSSDAILALAGKHV